MGFVKGTNFFLKKKTSMSERKMVAIFCIHIVIPLFTVPEPGSVGSEV